MNDPWRITLLGGLRAERGKQVITRFKTQKVASLFAYLAYHRRQAHSREDQAGKCSLDAQGKRE